MLKCVIYMAKCPNYHSNPIGKTRKLLGDKPCSREGEHHLIKPPPSSIANHLWTVTKACCTVLHVCFSSPWHSCCFISTIILNAIDLFFVYSISELMSYAAVILLPERFKERAEYLYVQSTCICRVLVCYEKGKWTYLTFYFYTSIF